MLKAVCQNTLLFHSHRKITARFDGGSLTSDAGWLLFGSLDRQHRLCEGFSSCISESRDRRYVRHDLLKLIRQRVLQIVAGYEDCNDADTLRSDPMLKTVCDQLPESDPDLATQPTFSRLENSVTKKDLMRLSQWLQFVELEEKQRQFDEFLYRAKSWDRSRRVIVKVEVDQRGINRRFVVTNRDDLCSQSLYDHYTNRGQTENFIKAFKNHLSMDRLSCHRFLANQFRLLLHALAYQMFVRLRDYLHGTPWHKLEIETLRRRVLKIGARIRQTTRRIWVHLSSAFPEQPLFHLVLSRLNSS